jgi:hypothetical protein
MTRAPLPQHHLHGCSPCVQVNEYKKVRRLALEVSLRAARRCGNTVVGRQAKWSREGPFKFELEILSVYLGNNEL